MWSQAVPWMTTLLAAVVCASPLDAAAATTTTTPRCRSVRFNVSGTAQNRNLTGVSLDDPVALQALILADAFPRITVSGPQTLAGTYCEPTVSNGNNNRLQVTFHSITTNRNTFSALGNTELGGVSYQPERYSWVQFATGKGYPTLSIDRLGNGLSSHPDPILVTQGPYEDELYHDLAQQIRAGRTGSLPRAFSNLIWVGNSYGSQLGSTSAQKYPQDWDAYVLTGFTNTVLPSLLGLTLLLPAPAAIVDPARFGTLAPGYVTPTNDAAHQDAFFGIPANVEFDPAIAPLFSAGKDVVSLGQFISVYSPSQMGVSPGYRGRVLVLDGEQDLDFCGRGSSTLGTPSCGNLPRDTASLFPAAQYNYRTVNRIGHAVQLHTNSFKIFDIAHRFLAGERFQGGPPA